MAERPTKFPLWATDPGADVVEPPEGKKEIGWQQGEKPPAGFFNWLFGLLGEWVAWFAERVGDDGEGGIRVAGLRSDAGGVRSFVAGEDSLAGQFMAEGDRARAIEATSEEDIAVLAIGKLGGEFVGDGGLRAEALADKPAVAAEVEEGSGGIPLDLRPDSDVNPERGAILIEPSYEPSQPARGEIYIDAQSNRVRWWDGAAWVDISIDSEESARHVVGAPGEPALEPGWADGLAPLYPPSFYRDGRRVWLDGYIQHGASAGELAFVLPVGFRPAATVIFDYPVSLPGATLQIHPDGRVEVSGVGSNVANVSFAGLSFEVAP